MASEGHNQILVVDDSPQISKALSDLLIASGYSVRTAPSAERALQMLESSAFDLILTDLKMTGMTGIDLARQAMERIPGLPVVILTGFGDMDSVISALRLGVADYLKKPFSIDEVLAVVQRELVKHTARSPVTTSHSNELAESPPCLYIFGQRDLEQIEAVLSRLRAQARAESALLVEQAGYVIAAKGMSSSVEIGPLSNLIAGARTTSASLASLLGETQDFSTSYLEGKRVSVYTSALGEGLYLAVIVPKETKQGLVWLYAKEAAVEIDRIVQRATEAMQKQLGHAVSAADAEALREEMAEQRVENVFEKKPVPLPLRLHRTPPSNVSTISFKKDKPQAEITTGVFAAKTSESAQPVEPVVEEEMPAANGIGFEEALRLGLLGDLTVAGRAPDESAPSTSEDVSGGLTPEAFDEALRKGLLDFGSE